MENEIKKGLQDFDFQELLDMIDQFAKIKHYSSNEKWKNGEGLLSVDELMPRVEDIIEELVERIKNQWTFERIAYNIKNNPIHIPSSIMNIYQITRADLRRWLYSAQIKIGAEEISEKECIWIIQNGIKYLMNPSGIIQESYEDKNHYII